MTVPSIHGQLKIARTAARWFRSPPLLLFRQLRDVAQNLEQRRGESAVFFLLDAVEQGLEPRVHHRPHALARRTSLLGDRDVADAHVLRPSLAPHKPLTLEGIER